MMTGFFLLLQSYPMTVCSKFPRFWLARWFTDGGGLYQEIATVSMPLHMKPLLANSTTFVNMSPTKAVHS